MQAPKHRTRRIHITQHLHVQHTAPGSHAIGNYSFTSTTSHSIAEQGMVQGNEIYGTIVHISLSIDVARHPHTPRITGTNWQHTYPGLAASPSPAAPPYQSTVASLASDTHAPLLGTN